MAYVSFKMEEDDRIHLGRYVTRLGSKRLTSLCGQQDNKSIINRIEKLADCEECLRLYEEETS